LAVNILPNPAIAVFVFVNYAKVAAQATLDLAVLEGFPESGGMKHAFPYEL